MPKLARDAAVVDGKAESSQTGTSPWPACMTERRNGVWADFCFSRFRPSPSARTTQTRVGRRQVQRVLEAGDAQAGGGAGEHLGDGAPPVGRGAGSAVQAGRVPALRSGAAGRVGSVLGPASQRWWPRLRRLPNTPIRGRGAAALAGMRHRGSGSGVHRAQGPGKEFGVLDRLQAVGLGADAQDDVLLGDGAAVAVVGLALRVAAAGRAHVQALAAGPGDGQGQLADRVGGLVVLRLGVDVAEHHGADLR